MWRLRGRTKAIFLYLLLGTTTFSLWFTTRSGFSHENKVKLEENLDNYDDNDRLEQGVRYAIQTPGCDILKFLPTNPSIIKYFDKNFQKLVCSKRLPLTEVSGLSLILHVDRMPEYGGTKKSIGCFYQGIWRVNQDPQEYNMDCDKKWELRKEVVIANRITPIREDGILVTCKLAGKIVYQNVHYFIQPLRALDKRQKIKAKMGDRESKPEKLSVVVLGTDSVSRGSLERLMPQTYKYLVNQLHAIDLQGFNKVADNTHPNLLAMLTGLSKTDLRNHRCQSEKPKSKFDDCPFIWKDFAEEGYVTAYGEDAPDMWAFVHDSPGFVVEPTDYYLRPYMQASEDTVGHNGGHKYLERNVCQGPKITMSQMHEYSLNIAMLLRDIPYFGFYWLTSLTHDLLNAAGLADVPSLEYLKRLHRGGYLEHTILFFISDHGLRFGDFRSTYAGMLEERLPYVTAVFPEWFKQKHPQVMRNFHTNSQRLTSTFDLHATLLEIVNRTYANTRHRPNKTHHGISLFREIPDGRTCEDAGIPEHFCSCERSKEVNPKNQNLFYAAESTISEINQKLLNFPACAQLSLDKVLNGRVWTLKNNTAFGDYGNSLTSYAVAFVTKPAGAILEATVRYQGGKYKLAFDASRINKFGNQSHCISHPVYKAYCYCKDLLS